MTGSDHFGAASCCAQNFVYDGTRNVGLNDDGQCDVSGWTDIIAVSAGSYNTVGLKSDGTVVAAGSNENNRSNVTGWKDIRLPVTDRDTDNDIIEAGTL